MGLLLALGLGIAALFAFGSKKAASSDGQIGILPGKQWRFTFHTDAPASMLAGSPDAYRVMLNQAIPERVAVIDDVTVDAPNGNIVFLLTYRQTVTVPPVGTVIPVPPYTLQLIQTEQLN